MFLSSVVIMLIFSGFFPYRLHADLSDKVNLPECSPENLKLVNASDGSWHLLPDGSFQYAFPHCQLRHFTRTMAAKCLKGSHIVLMGDSLSRYLYLSLVYLFAHNAWTGKFAKVSDPTASRSLLWEKDFPNWSVFYHKSNKLLNKGNHIMEICDCFRNDSVPFLPKNLGEPHQQLDLTENRHFRYIPTTEGIRRKNELNDQVNDVRITYLQWFGLMPMRGHREISFLPRNESILSLIKALNQRNCPDNGESFHPLSRSCAEQRRDRNVLHNFNFPGDFSHQLFDCDDIYQREKLTKCQKFEREVLGPLGTTHLILNIGWHSGFRHCDKKFLEKVMDGAERYFTKPGPSPTNTNNTDNDVLTKAFRPNLRLAKVTWRSSTHGAVFEGETDRIAKEYYQNETGKNRFDYFDVMGMTKVLREYHYKVEGKDHQGLAQMIKVSSLWPQDRNVNASTVRTMWLDHAHFEPWVYTEINNVFLNSICPIYLK